MVGRRKLLTAALVGVTAVALAGWIATPLPQSLRNPGPVPSVTLVDREGRLLRTTRSAGGSRGGWIPLAELDPKILQAFLAVEDHRFYAHRGVDVHGLLRALRDNLRAGQVVSGGSTITMQLARLLRGTPRSIPGKLSQMLWAWRLEAHLDKSTILEQYLNRVPLGQGAAGVAAAAALYADGDARQVSAGQAALLAGLAHAPSRDNPFVAPERARARRTRTLDRMVELGYLTRTDADRADREPIVVPGHATPFLAPHFTTRVLQWAEDSEPTLGPVGEWRTTLDLGLQTELEAEVRHTVDVLRDRLVAHAAAVVLDNRSGEVLAWVGSPDFFADTAGQVDMVVSPRQPGSALKPFLYGLAFDRGVTAATVLPDLPTTYQTTLGPYRPRNYDRRFHGPVRAREALGSSYNVPAVELANRVGVGALLRTLHGAGFVTLTHSGEYYGLGLALGTGDVSLLELANAYRGLANGGVWRPVRWRSDDPAPSEARGTVGRSDRRFVSRQAAALVLDILADPVARMPSFGTETPLDFPFRAAAKTGTSRHFTDNWAVATTDRFTVAVWVGNFNGRPMQGVGGITGAGPLLHRAVLLVARRYPPGDLLQPAQAELVMTRVCRLSGMLATRECPGMDEWFLPGTEPTHACDWHRGGGVALPAEYAEWSATAGRSDGRTVGPLGDVRPAVRLSDRPTFYILSPHDGDSYSLPVGADPRYATVALRAAGGSGGSVHWLVDGRPVSGERWTLAPGRHVIRAETPGGDRDEVRIDVR
jgi:penicillin-binding protein 1C